MPHEVRAMHDREPAPDCRVGRDPTRQRQRAMDRDRGRRVDRRGIVAGMLRNHAIDGAPVINGIPIVVKMAEMAVKLRRLTGLSVSRAGEFVKPPAEIIEEFMTHPKLG